MMKLKHMAAAIAIATVTSVSAHAASLVAGWDFSQYWTPYLTHDNVALSNELPANYSQLDPTFGLGVEAGTYGKMVLPFAAVGDGSEPFLPTNGSLASNLNAPVVGGGFNPFDSLSTQSIELPNAANSLNRMAAFTDTSGIVFQADLTTAGLTGSNWTLSFGAQMIAGLGNQTSNISIEFSTDGANYVTLSPALVTQIDTAYSISLGSTASQTAFIRLGFETGASIDNLAILADLAPVAEPATASLLIAGLVGLARFGRRRA